MIVSSRFNVSKWGRFKSKFNHVGRGWTISTSLNHHRINLSIIHVSKPPLSMPYIQILLLERPVFYSLLLSLQLPVCSDTADLLAPSAGDAGDLQLSGPDAVGWTHPRGGDGTLPQPDYGQEKGSWAFFFFHVLHSNFDHHVQIVWTVSSLSVIDHRWWRWWLSWWWPLPSAGYPITSTSYWDHLTETFINSITFNRLAAAFLPVINSFKSDFLVYRASCLFFPSQVYLAIFWLAMSSTMYNPIIYCCLNQR